MQRYEETGYLQKNFRHLPPCLSTFTLTHALYHLQFAIKREFDDLRSLVSHSEQLAPKVRYLTGQSARAVAMTIFLVSAVGATPNIYTISVGPSDLRLDNVVHITALTNRPFRCRAYSPRWWKIIRMQRRGDTKGNEK